MADNSTQSSKLDNFIKTSLKEFEVPADANSWAKMERMLDASSKSSNLFKNKKLLGSIAAGVGVVAIVSVFLLNTSSNDSEDETQTPAETMTEPAVNTTTESHEITTSVESKNTPENTTTVLPVESVDISASGEKPTSQSPDVKTQEPVKTNSETTAKTSDTKPLTKEGEQTQTSAGEQTEPAGTNFIDVFDKLKKDNVATFGDMIEPVKGFTKPTEEEERLQKEAEKKVKEENIFDTTPVAPNDSTPKVSSDPFR